MGSCEVMWDRARWSRRLSRERHTAQPGAEGGREGAGEDGSEGGGEGLALGGEGEARACVAQIIGLATRLHLAIIIFCAIKTCKKG
eukprot:2950440-Prymnesium_polylepis.1